VRLEPPKHTGHVRTIANCAQVVISIIILVTANQNEGEQT
jgi:nicotinamide mononucleotide adenylyltransferase